MNTLVDTLLCILTVMVSAAIIAWFDFKCRKLETRMVALKASLLTLTEFANSTAEIVKALAGREATRILSVMSESEKEELHRFATAVIAKNKEREELHHRDERPATMKEWRDAQKDWKS